MKQLSAPRLSKLRLIDLSVGATTCGLIVFGVWYQLNHASHTLLCKKVGAKHTIIYQNDTFQPNMLKLRRCDVLSIVNSSKTNIEPLFGTHEHHATYPGYQSQVIQPNEYIEIDAVQRGDFLIHDHIKDTARLDLTIK